MFPPYAGLNNRQSKKLQWKLVKSRSVASTFRLKSKRSQPTWESRWQGGDCEDRGWHVPPKRRLTRHRLHIVTSQKTELFVSFVCLASVIFYPWVCTDCSFECEIQELFPNIISTYFDALTLGPLSAFMIRDSCILRRSVECISSVSIQLFVSSLISNIRVHRKTFNYTLHDV